MLTAEEEKAKVITESTPYMVGKENYLIRQYFYVNQGLNVVNNFRNLVLGIFAAYFALKLTNPLWLIAAFILAMPVLVAIGWYQTHRMQKIFEWIGIRFSTYFGIRQFNYSQGTYEMLVEIKNLLQEKK